MDEEEYLAHLKDIVLYLEAMGCLTQVQTAIENTSERPRLGKAVNIPIVRTFKQVKVSTNKNNVMIIVHIRHV